MASALTRPRLLSARLAQTALVCAACAACAACATLPGCSKVRSVLIINRFHENIQVEIGGETKAVPADGHAFLENRKYLPSTGAYAYIRNVKGDLIRRVTFSFNTDETSENCYQDDLIVVEVGPE